MHLHSGVWFLTAAEESPAAAAEEIHQITQTQIGTGIATHGKATEISGLLAIGTAAMLNLVQCPQIFLIIRIHTNRLADMLQSCHLNLIYDSTNEHYAHKHFAHNLM